MINHCTCSTRFHLVLSAPYPDSLGGEEPVAAVRRGLCGRPQWPPGSDACEAAMASALATPHTAAWPSSLSSSFGLSGGRDGPRLRDHRRPLATAMRKKTVCSQLSSASAAKEHRAVLAAAALLLPPHLCSSPAGAPRAARAARNCQTLVNKYLEALMEGQTWACGTSSWRRPLSAGWPRPPVQLRRSNAPTQ